MSRNREANMDITTTILFLVFIVGVILHSYHAWANPEVFIKRMRQARLLLHKYSSGLLIPKTTKDFLDNNPKFEIILARFMFSVIYILIIYIVIIGNL
jgi:hypothetical protein